MPINEMHVEVAAAVGVAGPSTRGYAHLAQGAQEATEVAEGVLHFVMLLTGRET